MVRKITDDIVIVLAGEAGQGIQSIEALLSVAVKRSGLYYFSWSEFMSRVRGGSNSTTIRVSSNPFPAASGRMDLLVPLHPSSINHLKDRITSETVIIGEQAIIKTEGMRDVPFTKMAAGLGNAVYSNTIAAGLICGLLGLPPQHGLDYLAGLFARKTPDVQENNRKAFLLGMEHARSLADISIRLTPDSAAQSQLVMSGADAVALGALAGGCNYVCGYPMSPSTSVLEKMADYSTRHPLIVEQVEDEVGVINMALGAWYAGARAMVTTAGGGFALMCEGMSLCGMIESPLVVHLAQRPGPATGLPTRTEQGDLNLALYAGHGDFARVILAPGTLDQGYRLAAQAFELADRYQVPVILLTDQFYLDSRGVTPPFALPQNPVRQHVVKSGADYQRFALTADGLSPRGIPGLGSGCVCADSDEHDESGHITEDLELRVKMVNKRMGRFKLLQNAIEPPQFTGNPASSTLVLCWGSTETAVKAAVRALGRSDVAVAHFSWVFPLAQNIGALVQKAERIITVENNYNGQFADLLQAQTGVKSHHRILKYNGLAFTEEEIRAELEKILAGGR